MTRFTCSTANHADSDVEIEAADERRAARAYAEWADEDRAMTFPLEVQVRHGSGTVSVDVVTMDMMPVYSVERKE